MEDTYDQIMKLLAQIPEAGTIRQRVVLMNQIREQFRFYAHEANRAIEDEIFRDEDEEDF